jgi:hypothetical protein
MHENAFVDHPGKPSEAELVEALASAKTVWDTLIERAANEFNVTDQEWKSYSTKYGWTLRLKQKKRTIVYMSPAPGGFMASLILGDRAMVMARGSRFSKKVMKELTGATRYPEGTGLRIDVRRINDIDVVLKLMAIKLAN